MKFKKTRRTRFGSVSSTSGIKSSFCFLDEFFNVSKRQREKKKREVEIEFIEGQQSVSTLVGPSNDHLERRIHLNKIRKKNSSERCILSIVLMLICWSLYAERFNGTKLRNGRLKSFKSEIDLVERRRLSVAQLFDGLQTERKRWQYE